MNKLISIGIIFLLISCGSNRVEVKDVPVIQPKIVTAKEVVIESVPEPPVIEHPTLLIKDLKDESTDADTAKAYAVSIEQLKDLVEKLESALDVYRKKNNVKSGDTNVTTPPHNEEPIKSFFGSEE